MKEHFYQKLFKSGSICKSHAQTKKSSELAIHFSLGHPVHLYNRPNWVTGSPTDR